MRRDPLPDGGPATLFGRVQALLDELPGLFSDRVDLLSLELHSAGLALAQMLMWTVAAAILGVTAWLALCSGVAAALVFAGWPWQGVVTGVVILNLLVAAIAVSRARRLAPRLGLPLTRRHLHVGNADAAAADEHALAAGDMPASVVTPMEPGR